MRRFEGFPVYRGVGALIVLFGSLACLLTPPTGQAAEPGAVLGDLSQTSLYLRAATVEPTAESSLHAVRPGALAAAASAGHYVIQVSGPLAAGQRAALAAAGVALGQYLPSNAFIVKLPDGYRPAERLAGLSFVRWLGPYERAWKLDPELGRRNFSTAERLALVDRGDIAVTITLFAGEPEAAFRAAVAGLPGAAVHFSEEIAGCRTLNLTLRRDDVGRLADLSAVQFIEEAPEITLRNSTSRWIVQSNVSNVTPCYNNGITGVGQIVGILDSRVNRDHCSFRDAVNPIGPSHRKIVAYNTSAGYGQHGTHVAGTACGDAGANDNTRGIAYGARLAYNTTPSLSEASINSSLTTHHNQGARVHTNSWGNDGTVAYDGLCRGIDNFCRQNEDSLVLFAVTNTSTLKNPENAKNLIAVGASQDTPSQANFCSGGAGPTNDGRRKPEAYAPGCSTNSSSGSGITCGTAALTGTSMASPAVAGAAMLVRQYYTDGYYPTGTATPANAFVPTAALVKATVLNACVDMTGISGYPSNTEGWGRVLLDNALFFPGDARTQIVLADRRNATGLTTGQVVNETVNVVSSGQTLRVTLVWTEPPATSGANPAYINNLDLEVVAPNANPYLGNVFNTTTGVSITGGTGDVRKNVEQVILPSPPVGAWTVRVRALNVPTGPQGYALLVTGGISQIVPAPTITSITPDAGETDTIVSVTDLAGANFQSGASVQLVPDGIGSPINATGVTVVTPARITCSLNLAGAYGGTYDVIVTNPDAQSAMLPSGFNVTVTCREGDLDENGLVNGDDLQLFADVMTTGSGTPRQLCAADVNKDGSRTSADTDELVICLLNAGCSP